MGEKKSYLARVVYSSRKKEKIEVAFILYGSRELNIHFDEIPPTSSRFKDAEKMQIGDEVWVCPEDYYKIYFFKKNPLLRRLYVRTIKSWMEYFRSF